MIHPNSTPSNCTIVTTIIFCIIIPYTLVLSYAENYGQTGKDICWKNLSCNNIGAIFSLVFGPISFVMVQTFILNNKFSIQNYNR